MRRVLCGLALLAAALLAVSELLPLYAVITGGNAGSSTRTVTGGSYHAFAMLLLGLAAVPMALLAARGARFAPAALAAIGAIAVLLAFTVDLPEARRQGEVSTGIGVQEARAEPRIGFFVETLGGVLLIAVGGGLLLAPGATGRAARPEPEVGPREAPADA